MAAMTGFRAVLTAVFVFVFFAFARAGEIRIATSFYPVYIIALNVVKDVPGASLYNLTPSASGCLHDYSLTTADMKRLSEADVFVVNGAGMESFLDQVKNRFKSMKVIALADGMELVKNPDGSDNPHVWVSVGNAMAMAGKLAEELSGLDPVNERFYRSNAREYIAELGSLLAEMKLGLAPYKGARIVTLHEAFPYFAAEFGLDIAGVIEREPGSRPSGKDIAGTIELIRSLGVEAIFAEPQYPRSAVNTIARETGAGVYTLDPAVTGPDSRDAYIKIMRSNLGSLLKAFNGGR